jgi:hypothetical protein
MLNFMCAYYTEYVWWWRQIEAEAYIILNYYEKGCLTEFLKRTVEFR